jgi:hypothetical protein
MTFIDDNYLDGIITRMTIEHKEKIMQTARRLNLPDDDVLFLYIGAVEYTVQLCEDILGGISNERQLIEQSSQETCAANSEQALALIQELTRVGSAVVAQMQQSGMAATSAIAEANGEVLNQSKATVREAQLLNTQIKEATKQFAQVATTNQRAWQTMLEQNQELTARLQQLLVETNKTTIEQMNLTNKLLHVDIKVLYANLFGSLSPLVALLIAMLVGGLIANVLRG